VLSARRGDERRDAGRGGAALRPGHSPRRRRLASRPGRSANPRRHHEFLDWGDALDSIKGARRDWRAKLLPGACGTGLFGGVASPCPGDHRSEGSGAIIFMLRFWLARKIKRLGLQAKYDRFVFTRSDHFYGCPHDLSALDPRKIWVPKGQDWGGLTDRHLVCSAADVLKVLNVLPPVLRRPDRYDVREIGNPERLIKLRLIEDGLWENVWRFPKTFFAIKAPGDASRWRDFSESATAGGYRIKYPYERVATKDACGAAAEIPAALSDDLN